MAIIQSYAKECCSDLDASNHGGNLLTAGKMLTDEQTGDYPRRDLLMEMWSS